MVAIYSTFLQRAYDQLVHDVVLQNLPVLFAIDRAGLVGADGPTHAGSFDVAFMRCLPNMTIMSASSAAECRAMLSHGVALAAPPPCATRVARHTVRRMLRSHRWRTARASSPARGGNSKIAIPRLGLDAHPALAIADKLDATVANMRFVKPLDEGAIRELAASHELLVTVEEASVPGSAAAPSPSSSPMRASATAC